MGTFTNGAGRELGAAPGSPLEAALIKKGWRRVADAAEKLAAAVPSTEDQHIADLLSAVQTENADLRRKIGTLEIDLRTAKDRISTYRSTKPASAELTSEAEDLRARVADLEAELTAVTSEEDATTIDELQQENADLRAQLAAATDPEPPLEDLSRDQLDLIAIDEDIDNPDKLPNKKAVIDAIIAARTQKGGDAA